MIVTVPNRRVVLSLAAIAMVMDEVPAAPFGGETVIQSESVVVEAVAVHATVEVKAMVRLLDEPATDRLWSSVAISILGSTVSGSEFDPQLLTAAIKETAAANEQRYFLINDKKD